MTTIIHPFSKERVTKKYAHLVNTNERTQEVLRFFLKTKEDEELKNQIAEILSRFFAARGTFFQREFFRKKIEQMVPLAEFMKNHPDGILFFETEQEKIKTMGAFSEILASAEKVLQMRKQSLRQETNSRR